MKSDRELIIAMAEAENQTAAAVAGIMQEHGLPCFLMETIVDKVHRQLIDGKTSELEAAKAREAQKPGQKEET